MTRKAAEEAWVRRIVSESSTLGWRVLGRDRSGCLVAHTVLSCGHDTMVERHCLLTFSRAGLVHESARLPVGSGGRAA